MMRTVKATPDTYADAYAYADPDTAPDIDTDAYTDPDTYTDAYAYAYADTDTDAYADTYTDTYPDTYADTGRYAYTDAYAYTDTYADPDSDPHTYAYARADGHAYTYPGHLHRPTVSDAAHTRADGRAYTYPGTYTERHRLRRPRPEPTVLTLHLPCTYNGTDPHADSHPHTDANPGRPSSRRQQNDSEEEPEPAKLQRYIHTDARATAVPTSEATQTITILPPPETIFEGESTPDPEETPEPTAKAMPTGGITVIQNRRQHPPSNSAQEATPAKT